MSFQVKSLYGWAGLAPLPAEIDTISIEPLLVAGGDWRSALLSALADGDSCPTLRYRLLRGDALLADGRVGKYDGTNDVAKAAFGALHPMLCDNWGKPWHPEVSPCHPKALTSVLEKIGFSVVERRPEVARSVIGSVGEGPWAAQLSSMEKKGLDDYFGAEWPSGAAVWIDVKEIVCAPPAFSEQLPRKSALDLLRQHLLDVLLISALDGRAGHTDRWPVALPAFENDRVASDRYVRQMFRSVAARLGQNGRFTPGVHRYFVMNLWEPPDPALIESQSADVKEGAFAPATEFVFRSDSAEMDAVAREAFRTIVYLAASGRNNKYTVHRVSQRLFKKQRPALRLHPGRNWSIEPERLWTTDDAVKVPAILTVEMPNYGTYNDLAAYASQLKSFEKFKNSLWQVSCDGFFGFPWDSREAHEPSEKVEHIGRVAGRLVDEFSEIVGDDIWSALGTSEQGLADFGAQLESLVRECGITEAFDSGDVQVFYRAYVANSVFFDEMEGQHRQMPVALGTKGGHFIAGGTYLISHEKAEFERRDGQISVVDRYREAVGSLNSLQIGTTASRFLLSTAGGRYGRDLVEERETGARAAQEAKITKARLDKQLNNERVVKSALDDLEGAQRNAKVAFRKIENGPRRLAALWRATGENTFMRLTHTSADIVGTMETQLITEQLDEYLGKPWKSEYEQGDYPSRTIGQTCNSFHAETVALIGRIRAEAQDAAAYHRLTKAFKDRFCVWTEDATSFVSRCAQLVGGTIASVVNAGNVKYPSFPQVWFDALEKALHEAGQHGTDISLHGFVANGDSIEAGFVLRNRYTKPFGEGVAKKWKDKFDDALDGWAVSEILVGTDPVEDKDISDCARKIIRTISPAEQGVFSVAFVGKPIDAIEGRSS